MNSYILKTNTIFIAFLDGCIDFKDCFESVNEILNEIHLLNMKEYVQKNDFEKLLIDIAGSN